MLKINATITLGCYNGLRRGVRGLPQVDAPLGAVAPPLQGRAFQRPHRNHCREEACVGRVPQPGAEDEEDGEAARVYPGGVVIEPRWMGFKVVLSEERRRSLPCLHRSSDYGAPGQLDIRRRPRAPVAAQPPLLGILNANRKIRKRTDTDVAFTREYSRVSIFHRERECTN